MVVQVFPSHRALYFTCLIQGRTTREDGADELGAVVQKKNLN